MSDVATVEIETTEPAAPQALAPSAGPVSDDVLSLMRESLKETSAPAVQEEPAPAEGEAEPAATEPEKPAATGVKEGSRRAKTVERVLSASEQKVADAEAARVAAEAKAAELEAKLAEHEHAQSAEQQQARATALAAEHAEWLGTPEAYAEAERLALMDPDSPGWDWEKHKAAVTNLTTWKDRRTKIGTIEQQAEQRGRAETALAIRGAFVDELSKDLPEDKRDGYVKNPDGIPGAVRYYHQTLLAPIKEEYEATIAELKAEVDRLSAQPRGHSPERGGVTSGARMIDESRMSPEEIMAAGLREHAAAARRR